MPHIEPSRSYKVLVVEDEGLIAHDIAQRLESLGHEVIGPVATADEAVEAAANADIALMDIRIDGSREKTGNGGVRQTRAGRKHKGH